MIDVIIPVYKGVSETKACLESVWKSTVGRNFRVVVINDCSPEPELTAWLRLVAETKSIVLVENERNLGFVQTVNRGMALSSEHDVVLLNSDTEVFGNWLDRLRAAAYRTARTGTVTPFSNNATICSYPRFCEDNSLPQGWSASDLDALFASTNAGQEIEIPTAVGFCMYIRRDCLAETGEFDAESFGLGYGEENDFCMRAAQKGWKHVLAQDVFVWHKGNVSFGESHSTRKLAAAATLKRKHPRYQGRVRRHIALDPARLARVRVDWLRLSGSSKPLVVFVGHNRKGGTEKHMRELARLLSADLNVLYLFPDAGRQVNLEWGNPGEAMKLWFRMPGDNGALCDFLRQAGATRFHFHHTLDVPQEVLDLPEKMGVPWDFTAHDYYPLCPQITLTRRDNRYCGELGITQCNDCLKRNPAPNKKNIVEWRDQNRGMIEGASRVFVPCNDVAHTYRRYFPKANLLFVPHPEELRAGLSQVDVSRPGVGEALRIAIIGALSPVKGADLVEEVCLESSKRNLALSFCIFGYAYRALKTGKNLQITGEYEDDELPGMLQKWRPHVIWFPAQWPETYSYTLSTALALGLPVVATNLGAIAERINNLSNCRLLDWKSTAQEWCDFFVAFQAGYPHEIDNVFLSHEAVIRSANFEYSKDYCRAVGVKNTNLLVGKGVMLERFISPKYGIAGRVGRAILLYLTALRAAAFIKFFVRMLPTSFQRRVKSFLVS